MKRCPKCRRDYYDDTLFYCLDDGSALLEGPASVDEPAAAILHSTDAPGDAPTRAQINTTDNTAILPAGTEAEPQNSFRGASEKQSFSANRATKPLAVVVVAVVILVGGFFGYKYFSPTKQIESIAVMPFVNDSGNADVEYLSDGMTETLISSLSQLPNLNVKGRSSVFRYKDKDVDTKTLGKELGVQAVLYGRVIQRGDQLTLSLELLDAVTENVIWSGKYDRKQADVVTLQSEIARDVSNKLRTKLSGAEQNQVAKNYTANTEAYQLYLKGRFYWNKRTESDIRRSIEYFNQAIALDPAYALAYAGLADAWQVLPSSMRDGPPDETYPKARAAAQRALEIDSGLAEPHAALGVVLHEYDWNFAEAEKEFNRAIELDPNYASAHQWYGEYLTHMGRFDQALAEVKQAQRLDPLSLIINLTVANAYYARRHYDDAIAQVLKTLEIDPNFDRAQRSLIEIYRRKGMYEQAEEQRRKLRLLQGQPPEEVEHETTALMEAYRKSGERGYWKKHLEFALENARKRNTEISAVNLAAFQMRLGNKEQALDLLEKAFASGTHPAGLLQLKANPEWDPLRKEPRFTELLRKIGLPE